MITREQINLFIKYEANTDFYSRSCSEADKIILEGETFWKIESYLQNIIRMKNNVLSDDFTRKLMRELKENSFDDDIIDVLFKKFSQT